MSCHLVIITEIIAPYRIPVFNVLARNREIDLHVIFLADTDPTQRHWWVYKNEIRFSYQVLPSLRRRIGDHGLLLNWGMDEALLKASPDAIVCGGYNYFASWKSMRWARRNHVPFYLWVESTSRDARSGHFLVEFAKNNFLMNCDAFLAAGKSQSAYLKTYGIPEERIFTAPNAVDIDFFSHHAAIARSRAAEQRRVLDLPERFFLFAGRLVEKKGVFDLIEAYAALDSEIRKNFGLALVGEGSDRQELTRRSKSLGGNIQVRGFAQREELACYYALADVFVFPSHSDPWGLVVNEAMACGLPIICSDAAGCGADLVESGCNGRVFPMGNVSALALALEQLARDPALRQRMGQNSLERIQHYSPEACADGIARAALSRGVVAA